jgi:predicted O-methyltransferase YrrM
VYTLRAFIPHILRARRWTAFHSPGLFRLFMAAAHDAAHPPRAREIEAERARLKQCREAIMRTDHGAGSAGIVQNGTVAVSRIARTALSNPYQCRFMARLAGHINPSSILELGTSLGISAAYLAAAAPGAKVTTVEGDPSVAAHAKDVFANLNLANINLEVRVFRDYIDSLPAGERFDLVFLDGHHEGAALVGYFDALRPHMHEHTVVIVDDIYWSGDMTEGWKTLLGRPGVTQSVDAFRFGVLFFDTSFREREHHRIRLPVQAYSA